MSNIINSLQYYIQQSEDIRIKLKNGIPIRNAIQEARGLRAELENERNKNDKKIKEQGYLNLSNEFLVYEKAIENMAVKTTGMLTSKNIHSFLYDVYDYGSLAINEIKHI